MDLFTDQGDELAEDVPLGEQIIDQIDPQDLLEEVPDPPLPISYNPVPQYIIKDVKNLKAISKARNKRSSEKEEGENLPLNLTSTPTRASEVEMISPSGGAKLLSPSKIPLPDDSMEETPIRKPEDRGTKRKDVTPARVPESRKAKFEIFKRASSLTPLPYHTVTCFDPKVLFRIQAEIEIVRSYLGWRRFYQRANVLLAGERRRVT